MSQTVFGQTDALALVIVAWLAAFPALPDPRAFAVPIAAERRFARKQDLLEIPKYNQPASVDVIPSGIIRHRESMSTFSSLYGINIYIQQHVTGSPDPEAQCALLAQLQSQILEAASTHRFAIPSAVHPLASGQIVFVDSKPGDRGLYDLNRLEELNVFESDTILIFKAAA